MDHNEKCNVVSRLQCLMLIRASWRPREICQRCELVVCPGQPTLYSSSLFAPPSSSLFS